MYSLLWLEKISGVKVSHHCLFNYFATLGKTWFWLNIINVSDLIKHLLLQFPGIMSQSQLNNKQPIMCVYRDLSHLLSQYEDNPMLKFLIK